MWAHQYDQQVNQVQCVVSHDPIYTTNGPAANIFGLEPNFGCCTANMGQGWPKFAMHVWMRTSDEGRKCQNSRQGVVTGGMYPYVSHKKATKRSHFPPSLLILAVVSP